MKLLNHLEIEYEPDDENVKVDCLWCGYNALSIDTEAPHQFQCFRCKQTGNAFTYIRKFYDNLPALSLVEAKALCNFKKGLKPKVLRDTGIKCLADNYWIPVYNNKGSLVALHKYVPDTNIVYSSPKPLNLTVLGLQNLTKSDTVWIAEGHLDYLTILPLMVETGYDLLGTAGSYFATTHLSVLKNKHIVLLYDNDNAGKAGTEHVARHLKGNSIPILSLSYLDWSKITLPTGDVPNKFDIRDLYNVYN